jgi:heptose I phosphotransferase
MTYLRDDLKALFPERTVEEFLAIDGETVKQEVASRRTYRFERDGHAFYMKAHFGVGWREIFKNLLQLKRPILGAENEWRAIRAFERPEVGIETMRLAGYGKQGWNPARQRSFIMTDALDNTVDLEHWLPELEQWPNRAERLRLKRAIIRRLGDIGRRLHANGMNHRDFYLCHFRLDMTKAAPLPDVDDLHIYLMDLHRVEQRHRLPERWAVKDIAGLLYSALFDSKGIVLNRSDMIRFIEAYTGEGWREALAGRRDFWRRVLQRILRTYKRDKGEAVPLPACLQQWYDSNT